MNKNKKLKSKMISKYWGVIVFFQIFSAEAQSIVHNTGLNVIYQGFPNKILVSNPKIKRGNLEIFCKEARIIDSLGDFYIHISTLSNVKEIFIKIKDKRRSKWTDSFYYRVRKVPKPETLLGSLSSGKYSKDIIYSQSFLNATLSHFVYESIRARIVSYRLTIKNPVNMFEFQEILLGNGTQKLKEQMSKTKGYTEIIIDSVMFEQFGVMEFSSPLFLTVFDNPMVTKVNSPNHELIDIEAIPENYEKLKSYNYRINYQVNNLDTLLILSTFEEIDDSFTYSIYYPSKVPFKAISSFKINENKYHVNIFDTTGNLFADGYSSQLIHEFRGLYRDDFLLFDLDSSFQFNDVVFFMNINHILPEGKWTFYHPKLHQKMIVFFEKIIQKDLKLNHLLFNDVQPFKPVGTWQIIDNYGKVIEEIKN